MVSIVEQGEWGSFNLDFWGILAFLMILICTFSAWKVFRRKFEKAEGEDEIRNAIVPFLLMIIVLIIAIAVFIF